MAILKKSPGRVDISIKELLLLLLRKSIFIILSGILCSGLVYHLVCYFITPTYKTQVVLYVNNNMNEENGAITEMDLAASVDLVDTYSQILMSHTILKQVAEMAEVDISPEDLKPLVKIETQQNVLFKVIVEHPVAEMAQKIANAFADITMTNVRDIVSGSSVKVIDYAELPKKIGSPDYVKYIVAGFMLGIFVMVSLVVFLDVSDVVVHSKKDLENWEIPVIGSIPTIKKRSFFQSRK